MSEAPLIGELGDRVELQRRTVLSEDEGGHAVYFVPAGTLWARVRALGASRRLAADGRGIEASHSVVIRHCSGVAPGDRFLFDGRKLEVVSTEPIGGRKHFLGCRCLERRTTG